MSTKDLFTAEATLQKQHVKKGICQDTIPVLGSFADDRKKRSHNRMIDLHWALKHIALNYI